MEEKQSIVKTLGVKQLCSSDKYLGVPILLGKNKVKSFHSINEAFENKLQGWNSKILNLTSRSTMVKEVLNTIPTHYMGNFKLPKHTINKLNVIHRKFWWGYKSNKGLNFIARNSLSYSKCDGGLGFRDLEQYNMTLITKLAWRLCTESDQLWVKILKPKYSHHCEFIHLQEEHQNSS